MTIYLRVAVRCPKCGRCNRVTMRKDMSMTCGYCGGTFNLSEGTEFRRDAIVFQDAFKNKKLLGKRRF